VFGIVYSTTVARFPEAVFALAAALVLVAFGTTFFISEIPHVRKGKAPTAVAPPRRPVLIPERERGRSRTVKHIGDRLRKPPLTCPPAPATNDVSVGPSASTAGDEAV